MEVYRSVAEVYKSVAEVSKSVVEVSRRVVEVPRSVSEISRSVAEVSRSFTEVLNRNCAFCFFVFLFYLVSLIFWNFLAVSRIFLARKLETIVGFMKFIQK